MGVGYFLFDILRLNFRHKKGHEVFPLHALILISDRGTLTSDYTAFSNSDALWPPKPRELFRQARILNWRAWFGT